VLGVAAPIPFGRVATRRRMYPVNQVRRIGTTMQTRSRARAAADSAADRTASSISTRRTRQQRSFQSRRMIPTQVYPVAHYPPGYARGHDEL